MSRRSIDATPAAHRRRAPVLLPVLVSVLGMGSVLLIAASPSAPYHPLLPDVMSWFGAGGDWLGLGRLPPTGLAAAALAAMSAAVASFLVALRESWYGRIGVRTAVSVSSGFMVATLAVPLLGSRDVYSYAVYGRIASLHGGNPYVQTPAQVADDPFAVLSAVPWRDVPSVYGPGFSLVSEAITTVSSDVRWVVLAFRTLAVLAAVATLLLIAFVSRELAPQRSGFAVVLFGWNPVVVFSAVGGAHNDVLVGAALVGALALVLRRHEALATATLTLAATIKVGAAIPLGLWLVWVIVSAPTGRRRWLRALQHGALVLAVGAPLIARYWAPENPTLGVTRLTTFQGGFSVVAFLIRVVDGDSCGVGCSTVRWAALVTLAVVLSALAWRLAQLAAWAPAELGATWAWALVAAMLLTAFMQPWYLVWVLPLAFLAARPVRALVLSWGSVMVLSQIVAEPSRGRRWYDAMSTVRDWGIRPLVGALLLWLLWGLTRRLRAGASLADVPRPA